MLKKTFEASPLYIFNPLVPQRIHDLVPDTKLVLILRNPVERTISHYFHTRRKGYEDLPIEKALKCEQDRISEALKKEDYKDRSFRQISYKNRGIYHVQIERYLELFRRDQLLILSSENFYANPSNTVQRVCEFVGVRSDIPIHDIKPRNVGSNRKNVDTDIYEDLQEFFEPYNRELYKLIGENFGW
ncbi:sulfotransferase domain-containing protein [Salinisphaera orenii]|uniref:sulfotransferase domain-containing protein n=1 Tax=Salinisphaera orenii TaxID=856731 RepID=UPI000DBE295C